MKYCSPTAIAAMLILVCLALVVSGCGGSSSLSSPRIYSSVPNNQTPSDSTGTDSDGKDSGSSATGQVSDRGTAPTAEGETPQPVEQNADGGESRKKLVKAVNPSAVSDDKHEHSELINQDANLSAIYHAHVDHADSASAVDDDIWRLFDLADEYHGMGVIANREASWEEARYYFEKCLKILAALDVDEQDTVLTPEATKYTAILDNVVADYRVTLRSLGRLENDVAPNILVERFGDIEERLGLDTLAVYNDGLRDVTYDLPVVINDRVKKSIIYFQTDAKEAFIKYLTRSKRYTGMFKQVLAEYNMPMDFIYLSLVESGYNPRAYSWARASGLWQFISSTGRMYGLNRSWWVDERRDPVKSTHAAARFLKDLYKKYGDWELAMAAYNGGPGRVSRTIKKQGTIDFWKLNLRRQTMDYVPLIYAAAIIAKNPEKYGFTDIEFEPPVVWDEVTIDRCLDLKIVAKELGCKLQDLKDINPELLRNYTPPNVKKYVLKVPIGSKEKFFAAYESMPSPKETSWVKHKIRRGETVSTIASRYGVSQYAVFEANNLSRRSKIYAGKTLIVPVPLDREYSSSKKSSRSYEADNSIYAVRSGDTMWDIARAFGTSVAALRRINYIERGSRIYVGQKLKIPSDATKLASRNNTKSSRSYATVEPSGPSSGGSSTNYKVKSGDTLWDIARAFGTTTSRLRQFNGLGRSSRIYPGQILRIAEGEGADYVVYRVKRGDTLSKIASRYRTSISKILAANGLTNPDNLPVGLKLRINLK